MSELKSRTLSKKNTPKNIFSPEDKPKIEESFVEDNIKVSKPKNSNLKKINSEILQNNIRSLKLKETKKYEESSESEDEYELPKKSISNFLEDEEMINSADEVEDVAQDMKEESDTESENGMETESNNNNNSQFTQQKILTTIPESFRNNSNYLRTKRSKKQ